MRWIIGLVILCGGCDYQPSRDESDVDAINGQIVCSLDGKAFTYQRDYNRSRRDVNRTRSADKLCAKLIDAESTSTM